MIYIYIHSLYKTKPLPWQPAMYTNVYFSSLSLYLGSREKKSCFCKSNGFSIFCIIWITAYLFNKIKVISTVIKSEMCNMFWGTIGFGEDKIFNVEKCTSKWSMNSNLNFAKGIE